MIKFERVSVVGLEPAIRGMRNPLNSWDKSDSGYCRDFPSCQKCTEEHSDWCEENEEFYVIGKADKDLGRRLVKAGPSHRKFLRQIVVYVDITAPLYWWKEFDTYKVGTVANSCSTMHKIHAKEFELKDFSWEKTCVSIPIEKDSEERVGIAVLNQLTLDMLNGLREEYLKTKDKKYWYAMIQSLPTSYNQMRTVMLNYETLLNILETRAGHKLEEWHKMIDFIQTLPYYNTFLKGEMKDV